MDVRTSLAAQSYAQTRSNAAPDASSRSTEETIGQMVGSFADTLAQGEAFYEDQLVPTMDRLAAAGLVETAPEDYALTTKYEMLETDDVLRKLMAQMKTAGQRSQIKRKTLKISELGRNLWEACRITED